MKQLLQKSYFILMPVVLFYSCSGDSSKKEDSVGTTTTEEVVDDTAQLDEEALNMNGTDSITAIVIGQKLANDLLADDMEYLAPEDRRFRYATCDLNDDGRKEYLIEMRNSYFCGSGGCTFFLLDSDLQKMGEFTVSYTPFIISKVRTSGWRDIIIPQGTSFHVMKFDGATYPSNPSVEPAVVLQGDEFKLLEGESEEDIPVFTF